MISVSVPVVCCVSYPEPTGTGAPQTTPPTSHGVATRDWWLCIGEEATPDATGKPGC